MNVPPAPLVTPAPLGPAAQCAGIPATAGAPLSTFVVPAGSSGPATNCQVIKALAAGQVVVSYNDDSVLAAATGEGTDSDSSVVVGSDAPIGSATPSGLPSPPGTLPSDPPGTPAPGVYPQTALGQTAYALYVNPKDGTPYSYEATGYTTADVTAAINDWIGKTLSTLGSQRSVADIQAPVFDSRAWTLIANGGIASRSFNNPNPGKNVKPLMGSHGASYSVYRLNTNDSDYDYFLVQTQYSQNPNWVGYEYYFPNGHYLWWNQQTQLQLSASDPFHPNVTPLVYDYAPQTAITTTDTTLSVGGKLTGKVAEKPEAGGEVNVGWSQKTTQASVTTSVNGSILGTTLGWTDNYVPVVSSSTFAIILSSVPATTTSTFTGARLAVFQVPRAVNDVTGQSAGLRINGTLASTFAGYVGLPLLTGGRVYSSTSTSTATFFAPVPSFNVSPRSLTVSRGTSATISVTAQQYAGQKQLRWNVVQIPSFVTLSTDQLGRTGNGTVTLFVKSSATPGQTEALTINTNPPGAADSVRQGSISIPVTVQ